MIRWNRRAALPVLVGIVLTVSLLAAVGSFWREPAGRAGHEAYLAPDTAIRIVLQPAKVQRYISRLAPAATRFVTEIPKLTSMQRKPIRLDWIHSLPYEFSFLLAQESPERLTVTLFINDIPEARDFEGVVNDSSFWTDIRPVVWNPPRLSRRAPGVLLAAGNISIPPGTRERVLQGWPAYTPFSPPELEGRYLMEIAVDNTNGVLAELAGGLVTVYGAPEDPSVESALSELWPAIIRLTFTGDLHKGDDLVFRLRLEAADGGGSDAIRLALETVTAYLGKRLQEKEGWVLSGDFGRFNKGVLEGEFHLTGFEADLRRRLGG